MITPRIKPSSLFPKVAPDDLFLVRQRKAKLEGYAHTLAAIDELIDFSAMAAAVNSACPRADRSKGGRQPYVTKVLVRMVFLQCLSNLSDEQCEHQILDRLSLKASAGSTARRTSLMPTRCRRFASACPQGAWAAKPSSRR